MYVQITGRVRGDPPGYDHQGGFGRCGVPYIPTLRHLANDLLSVLFATDHESQSGPMRVICVRVELRFWFCNFAVEGNLGGHFVLRQQQLCRLNQFSEVAIASGRRWRCPQSRLLRNAFSCCTLLIPLTRPLLPGIHTLVASQYGFAFRASSSLAIYRCEHAVAVFFVCG